MVESALHGAVKRGSRNVDLPPNLPETPRRKGTPGGRGGPEENRCLGLERQGARNARSGNWGDGRQVAAVRGAGPRQPAGNRGRESSAAHRRGGRQRVGRPLAVRLVPQPAFPPPAAPAGVLAWRRAVRTALVMSYGELPWNSPETLMRGRRGSAPPHSVFGERERR